MAALERVTEKWTSKYPNSMKRWDNGDAIFPSFKERRWKFKCTYVDNLEKRNIIKDTKETKEGEHFL